MQEIKKIEIKNKAQEALHITLGAVAMVGAYALTPVTLPVCVAINLKRNGVKRQPREKDMTKEEWADYKKAVRRINGRAALAGLGATFVVPYRIAREIHDAAIEFNKTRIEKYNEGIEKAKKAAQTKEYITARNAVHSQDAALLGKLNKVGLGSLLELISNSEVEKEKLIANKIEQLRVSKVNDLYITKSGMIMQKDPACTNVYLNVTEIPEDLRIYIKAAIDIKDEQQKAQKKAKEIADIDAKIKAELAAAKARTAFI